MEKVVISKLDNYGRGICYINDKITFVFNALPTEKVIVDNIINHPKYQEASVIKYEKIAINREEPECPYFNKCGGCQLLHMSYEDALEFKHNNLKNILSKYAGYNGEIKVNPCSNPKNYRNKVTLKIENYKVGYYEGGTHKLIEIDKCLVASKAINNFIKDITKLNIANGTIVIRSNFKDELLLSINADQKVKVDKELLTKYKIVGIVLNDEILYGNNYFIDKINNLKFKVSYNSFFQINPFTTSIVFDKMKEIIKPAKNALDLYCGVGTLGINICDKVDSLYGVDIIENAITDADYNANTNIVTNAKYYSGNVNDVLPTLPSNIDLIIIDPPRNGLDKETRDIILNIKPKQIIYMSCDAITFARDLSQLQTKYEIQSIEGFDMFPYTYHVECVCILNSR